MRYLGMISAILASAAAIAMAYMLFVGRDPLVGDIVAIFVIVMLLVAIGTGVAGRKTMYSRVGLGLAGVALVIMVMLGAIGVYHHLVLRKAVEKEFQDAQRGNLNHIDHLDEEL